MRAHFLRVFAVALLPACGVAVLAGCNRSDPSAISKADQAKSDQFLTALQNTPQNERGAFLSKHQNDVIAISHGSDDAAKQKLASLMN